MKVRSRARCGEGSCREGATSPKLERHARQRCRRYVGSSEGGGASGGVQVGPRLVQEGVEGEALFLCDGDAQWLLTHLVQEGVEGEALFLGALQEEVRRGELRLRRL